MRKYDTTHALELGGLKALTPVQSEAFEEYWKVWWHNYVFGT